jgi:hypothetical protein
MPDHLKERDNRKPIKLINWPKLMLKKLLTLKITMLNMHRRSRRQAPIFTDISKMRSTQDPAEMMFHQMDTTTIPSISRIE